MNAKWLFVPCLVAAISPAIAHAGGLENWQGWGGSVNTQGLVMIRGPADFTGDGKLDVAVYKASNRKIWIGRNTGTGFSFCASSASNCLAGAGTEQWATLPAMTSTCQTQGLKYQIAAGRFNLDSFADLVVYDPCAGTVKARLNSQSSTFVSVAGDPAWAALSPTAGWSMVAGNYSGSDVATDVVVYHPSDGLVYVGQNNTPGGLNQFAWSAWAQLDSGAPAWNLQTGDFDGNGVLDLFANRPVGGQNVRVGINQQTSFTMQSWGALDAGGFTPVVGRFSGTPRADLAVQYGPGDSAGKFDVLRNSQGGFFLDSPATWTTVSPIDLTWSFMAGDFVATSTGQPQGIEDLFAYHPGDGSFWIARNNGAAPEGYVWPLSGAPGDTLGFSISGSLDNTLPHNVEIRRIEADANGDLTFADPGGTCTATTCAKNKKIATVHQPVLANAKPWENGPAWSTNLTLTIPPEWTSGLYVANLRGVQVQGVNQVGQVIFVVKPAAGLRQRTAVLANVNTWNAYNDWGGRMKYNGTAVTTFLRPNTKNFVTAGPTDPSFEQMHLAQAEGWLLGAMTKIVGEQLQGQRIDVYTDIDFHAIGSTLVSTYDRWILSVHPEYWSTQMYDNLGKVIAEGSDLLYLGGNGIFEIMSYPTASLDKAQFLNGIDNSPRSDALFRVKALGVNEEYRPERKLLGVATYVCHPEGRKYSVAARPAAGTPRTLYDTVLRSGASTIYAPNTLLGIAGKSDGALASGHEVDIVGDLTMSQMTTCGISQTVVEPNTTPSSLVLLAGPEVAPGAHMTIYRASTRGVVFSAGSIDFGQSLVVDPDLKQIVGNVVRDL